jgi:hypothetical protein
LDNGIYHRGNLRLVLERQFVFKHDRDRWNAVDLRQWGVVEDPVSTLPIDGN